MSDFAKSPAFPQPHVIYDPRQDAMVPHAKRQFGAQLDACGDAAIIDGSNVGPYPLDGGRNG